MRTNTDTTAGLDSPAADSTLADIPITLNDPTPVLLNQYLRTLNLAIPVVIALLPKGTNQAPNKEGTGKTRNEEMGNEETEIGNGLVSH